MKIIKQIEEMQNYSEKARKKNILIGLVPTMGFFHEGHLSLIRKSVLYCNVTVVSLFVNPAQFAPGEDLEKYPRDFDRDVELADNIGTDIIFAPDANDIYTREHDTFVEVKALSNILCGKSRPTHFRGVTTIVSKLFNIINPDKVYFGQKDAQQAIIIHKLIKELNYNIDMNILPIIREEDGLAMSSRNKFLSIDERKRSICLYSALTDISKRFDQGERAIEKLIQTGISKINSIIDTKYDKIDYVEIRDANDLSIVKETSESSLLAAIAVYIGKTRLIDNIILNNSRSGV